MKTIIIIVLRHDQMNKMCIVKLKPKITKKSTD